MTGFITLAGLAMGRNQFEFQIDGLNLQTNHLTFTVSNPIHSFHTIFFCCFMKTMSVGARLAFTDLYIHQHFF